MRLHLGGHLAWYDPQKRSWLELPLPDPTSLVELVRQLGLPEGEIAVVAVNGRAVSLEDALVSDGDRVELYPPLGGGSRARSWARKRKPHVAGRKQDSCSPLF